MERPQHGLDLLAAPRRTLHGKARRESRRQEALRVGDVTSRRQPNLHAVDAAKTIERPLCRRDVHEDEVAVEHARGPFVAEQPPDDEGFPHVADGELESIVHAQAVPPREDLGRDHGPGIEQQRRGTPAVRAGAGLPRTPPGRTRGRRGRAGCPRRAHARPRLVRRRPGPWRRPRSPRSRRRCPAANPGGRAGPRRRRRGSRSRARRHRPWCRAPARSRARSCRWRAGSPAPPRCRARCRPPSTPIGASPGAGGGG